MDPHDEFLAWVRSTLTAAEIALHNGDPEPRREIWSRREPVSVLGAWKSVNGRAELDALFTEIAGQFADCTSYELEVLASEVLGDTAYTVALEHISARVRGEDRSYTLRATQIYRREDGEWKVAHRHGSAPPVAPV